MNARLQALSDAGVSIWLDDLSRERIETGNLDELVKSGSVVGVTTNPAIFQAALSDGERYDDQLRALVGGDASVDVDAVAFELTTEDVRNACDVLRPVFDLTHGVDGRVSIEVSPDLAHETQATIDQARALWSAVDRPNVLIKIPGTVEGCPAITEVIGEGISVNVTLIFGLEQYAQVMEAYVAGLERARDNGHDLSRIHSVASFFVSRVDTEIDRRLDASDAPPDLKGKAGVANARLAFEAFEDYFSGARWDALAAAGANRQRPLWASTGVKNPEYDDTMYVVDLVVAETVNTMPEKTLEVVADHGDLAKIGSGDQVRPFYDDARAQMQRLAEAGIDYDDVIDVLLKEGVDKFVAAWHQLLEAVQGSIDSARGAEHGNEVR